MISPSIAAENAGTIEDRVRSSMVAVRELGAARGKRADGVTFDARERTALFQRLVSEFTAVEAECRIY